MRNDIILNGGCLDHGKLMELIRWRVAMSSKAKWPGIVEGLEDIIRYPHLVLVPSRCPVPRRSISWSPPVSDSLRLNIDSSAFGQPNLVGIKGNFKGSWWKCKKLYSPNLLGVRTQI